MRQGYLLRAEWAEDCWKNAPEDNHASGMVAGCLCADLRVLRRRSRRDSRDVQRLALLLVCERGPAEKCVCVGLL